jgi:Concanavalin A-like lectin/glucanases superfamily
VAILISRFQAGALLCATLAVAVGCSSRTASQSVVPDAARRHVRTVFIQPPYDKAVLALSPYAYYRLDEVNGTVAVDSSGNNRNGTYQGTSGTHYLLGQAAIIPYFTHSAQFYSANPGGPKVTLPAINLGSSTTAWVSDFTVAAWVKPDPSQLSQLNAALEINGYYMGESGGSSGTSGTKPYMGGYVNGGEYFSPTATFADGNAHFLTETVHYNASGYCDMNLYVDGALAKSAPSTRCSGGPLNGGIGSRLSPTSGSLGFFGEIAGVALFSKVLTAAQIANLYNPPPPPPTPGPNYDATVLASSPYAYYRLDETSGTVAVDSSGNGRNGTYQGTSGTHYQLGQTSIVPGLSATAKFFSANPGQPKVSIPSVPLASNGSIWQSDFTVALWAMPDPTQQAQANDVVDINDYYVGQAAAGTTNGTNPYMGVYPTGNWYTTTGPNFGDGAAHFLSLTVHRNAGGTCDMYLYIDAVQVQSAAGTACSGGSSMVSSTNAGIGGRVDYQSGYAGYFGEIGGVAIFASAMTATQISNLYTGTTPPPTPTPTPTPTPGPYDGMVMSYAPYAYYKLDETSGTIAADSSGHNRNASYQGTPGTHYQLGQTSIVPGYASSLKVYSANPGQPKVVIPTVALASNGSTWQSDFSVALWAKPDPTQPAQTNDVVEINDYYVGQGAAGGAASTYPYMGAYPPGNWFATSGPNFGDGAAHLLTMTVHRNTAGTCDLLLYVDGTQVQTALGSTCTGANSILSSTNAGIGARVDYSSGFAGYFGELAGVAIFDKILAPADVQALYTGIPAH